MDLSTQPRLYAYTGGRPFDPAKPTVVFVHGAQHDHSVWILQSRYLAHHGYGVLALDLPGHMRSEGPPLDQRRGDGRTRRRRAPGRAAPHGSCWSGTAWGR